MLAESQNSNSGRYAPCPECRAVNMAHRVTCYLCKQPLNFSSASLTSAGGAETQYLNTPPAKNRRRIPRKKVTITDVRIDDQVTSMHHGTILDITPLGVCLQTGFECRIGASLVLLVPLEGRNHKLYGVVRYREESEQDGIAAYTYGIKLDPPDRESFGAIERLEPDHTLSLVPSHNDPISEIVDELPSSLTSEYDYDLTYDQNSLTHPSANTSFPVSLPE